MAQYVCSMKGISKTINGKQIIKETWLSFLQGAKIGIIGHNGAGKSTLLKIIAGVDKDFDGELWIDSKIKVGYLSQEPQLDATKNVFENILEAVKDKKELIDKFNEVSAKFAYVSDDDIDDLIQEQANLQEQIDLTNSWDFEREVELARTALRCPPGNAKVSEISGGEKRRVALCKLLLEKPSILLLDEPTNHLDAQSVSWLEYYLANYPGTVISITHDRYFLDNVTDWILEIERGECIPWHSNYTKWLEQKTEKMQLEEKEESNRKKELAKELEWINQSPKARQAKNKARIQNYQELLSKQQEKHITIPQIIIPNGPRLGDMVIEFENVSKSFGNKVLIEGFSFKIPPGAIIGITGPNGAGKTTFFKMIQQQETPDNGIIHIGKTVKLGIVDQTRDHLNDEKTVWEEISDGLDEMEVGDRIIKSRAYCAAFNFKGGDQQKKIGQLSGGERNRVHMAKLLKSGANVILLDEPSNDLDIDTLRALEDAILDFSGCVLVISHDRWFLDRIVTHIIAFQDNGNVLCIEGNYQDYYHYVTHVLGREVDNAKYKHKLI